MAQEIVLSPDERLRTECAPVEVIDDEIKKTAKKMAKLMYKYDGCGIAAPQIGVLKQIVVIDCNWGDTLSTSSTPTLWSSPRRRPRAWRAAFPSPASRWRSSAPRR